MSWLGAGFGLFGEHILWTDLIGSAVATFAQSRSLVDFWIIWVLVDLVGVPLALKSGLYVSGAVYGIFFVMVMVGFRNWFRESRDVRAPRHEAVAA